MRRQAKVDRNQADTVSTLRRLGFHVMPTHQLGQGRPDFVATGYSERTQTVAALLVELKASGGSLTDDERRFHREYPADGPLIVAFSAEDVLRWFGRAA